MEDVYHFNNVLLKMSIDNDVIVICDYYTVTLAYYNPLASKVLHLVTSNRYDQHIILKETSLLLITRHISAIMLSTA